MVKGGSRLGIDLVQESTTVLLGEYPREAPRLMLEWLYILYFDQQQITLLGSLNLEGSGEVVDLREIDVSHVIRRVIVANLATGPVHALDFDRLVVLDGAIVRDCGALLGFNDLNGSSNREAYCLDASDSTWKHK